MVRQSRSEWKAVYFKRLGKCLAECEKCFIVNVDNVRSKQMQQIRIALRGSAELVLGKNTLIKKVIHGQLARNNNLEKLLPHIRENVGFVFTKNDLHEIREKIEANRVEAPAKAGAIAPCDVIVPAQNTGLSPDKTDFFQALCIPTKIARGAIEILNDVHLVHKDQKVGMSEATLLGMLKIHPFTYGLVITQVYDQGSVYDPAVLDITTDVILEKFMIGVKNVACISLAIEYTTLASLPHILTTGFKNILALSLACGYIIKEAEQMHEFLADPSKFQTTVPQAVQPETKNVQPKAAPAPVVSASESEDSDLGMGLFD